MPYEINGKTYTRVSEILAGITCPYINYIKSKIPEEKMIINHHFISFPGTNVHREISRNMPSTLPELEKEIINTCNWDCTNGDEQDDAVEKQFRKEVEKEDSPLKTMYDLILKYRIESFYDFLKDFSPEVVFSEFTFISDKLDIAGTVDACYIVNITEENIGYITNTKLEVGDRALVILDYKSGKSYRSTYGMQLILYHLMMEEKGIIDIIGNDLKVVLWSCVLGKEQKRKGIKYGVIEVDKDEFELLAGLDEAFELYKNPLPYIKYGMHCTFCSVMMYCPTHIISTERTDKITKGEYNDGND